MQNCNNFFLKKKIDMEKCIDNRFFPWPIYWSFQLQLFDFTQLSSCCAHCLTISCTASSQDFSFITVSQKQVIRKWDNKQSWQPILIISFPQSVKDRARLLKNTKRSWTVAWSHFKHLSFFVSNKRTFGSDFGFLVAWELG